MSESLTRKEVADLLKCSVRSVDSLRKNYGLPCVKLNRLVRFSREAVEAWLEEKQKSAPGVKSLENNNKKEA